MKWLLMAVEAVMSEEVKEMEEAVWKLQRQEEEQVANGGRQLKEGSRKIGIV